MQFIDEAKIFLKSGEGGSGCVSFRREAHVPRGGPDGGNGGRGGSVIVESVPGLNTLIDFRYQQHFKARKGEHGKGSCRDGKASEDLIVKVPIGTQILADDGETILYDITQEGERHVVLKGGDGGKGNAEFKSSVNQAPRKATPGWPAQEIWVWLKLKLLSDAGLVGLPNAGKSTFLSAVTRAKPKIADYPFTTIKPQLGVTYVDGSEFVIADLPGLIEGAHEGHGLGHRFLKHVERCGVILHLVDGTDDGSGAGVAERYQVIRNELEQYNPLLAEKHEVVALTKCDAMLPDEVEAKKLELEEVCGKSVFIISSVARKGTEELLRALLDQVKIFRHEFDKDESDESDVEAESDEGVQDQEFG